MRKKKVVDSFLMVGFCPMALSAPDLPDTKLRTSISLPARIVITADQVVARAQKDRPQFNFSQLISEALIAYADKHHPGLRDQIINEIDGTPSLVTGHPWYRSENPTGKKISHSKFQGDSKRTRDSVDLGSSLEAEKKKRGAGIRRGK